jgi:chemotaxis protein MotB
MARRPEDKKGESRPWGAALVSVSDLMSGLLFIFILLVVAYAIELNRITDERRRVVNEITNSQQVRVGLLMNISDEMHRLGVQVEVDPEHGILRIPEGILFASGDPEVTDSGRVAVGKLASVLAGVLPCYTGRKTDPLPSTCSRRDYKGEVEAVFIEGHTDTVRVRPGRMFRDNWELSTLRAINAFTTMMIYRADLDTLRNARGEPIFSVSGYADRRPVAGDRLSNRTEQGRAHNRRIDLRFIMSPPEASPEVVRETRRRLTEGGVRANEGPE